MNEDGEPNEEDAPKYTELEVELGPNPAKGSKLVPTGVVKVVKKIYLKFK